MTPDEEIKFKVLRHQFYRLAHHRPEVLRGMGLSENQCALAFDHESAKALLTEIANQGRLPELEKMINKKESEIMMKIGHVGDPCQYCGIPMMEVKPGPCPVRKKMVDW